MVFDWTNHSYRRTGVARPLSSVPGRNNKRKPPRGLVVNFDDLAALAGGHPDQANNILQAIDTEIVSLKRQVRWNQKTPTSLSHPPCRALSRSRVLNNWHSRLWKVEHSFFHSRRFISFLSIVWIHFYSSLPLLFYLVVILISHFIFIAFN